MTFRVFLNIYMTLLTNIGRGLSGDGIGLRSTVDCSGHSSGHGVWAECGWWGAGHGRARGRHVRAAWDLATLVVGIDHHCAAIAQVAVGLAPRIRYTAC